MPKPPVLRGEIEGEDVMPSPRPMSRILAETMLALSESVKRLQPQEPSKELVDPLVSAIKERLGKLPPSITLRHAQVVKEPLCWLLMLNEDRATEEVVVDQYGAPGPLVAAWRRQAEAMWVPPTMNEGDAIFSRTFIQRLQGKFIQLGQMFFLHPEKKSVEHLFSVVDETLSEAQDLVKELDGRYIRSTDGPKAAQEFYRAYRLRATNFSITMGPVVSRVAVKDGYNSNNQHQGPRRKFPRKEKNEEKKK